MMDISVAVVVFNAETHIEGCLRNLLTQEYPLGKWEVLLVDGASTDRTKAIAEKIQGEFPRLRILSNPARQIAAGRNVGLRESAFPYVAFTDSDCLVPKGWLLNLSEGFHRLKGAEPNLVGVGGGNVPPAHTSLFLDALGICLNSWLMSFNSVQGRTFSQPRRVSSLACLNVLFEKRPLLALGGFDQTLGNIAEDLDMGIRLRQNGHELYYLPGVEVIHALRPNLDAWLRNMALYGRGRAMISFKHRSFLTPFFVLPNLFALSLAALPFGMLFPPLFLPIIYIPCIVWFSAYLAISRRRPTLAFRVAAILSGTHLMYALNLALESLRQLLQAPGSTGRKEENTAGRNCSC